MSKIKWIGPKKTIVKLSSPAGRVVKYVASVDGSGRFTFTTDKKYARTLTRHQVRLLGVRYPNNTIERLPPHPCLIPCNLSMGDLIKSLGVSQKKMRE